MDEFLWTLSGIEPMWVIVCFETLIVLGAMAVDFFSGFYRAKLRGEIRTSLGMKRTVSKFILYVGSVLIACGIDSIFFVCGFWKLAHLQPLTAVPVVTSVVAVFICAVEIRSIWEKAENKQRKTAINTIEAFVQLLGKETFGEKAAEFVNTLKSQNSEDAKI